jgi:DNA-binding NarL/FixJ family response regulator
MSDKFILSEDSNEHKFNWNYLIWVILFLSMVLNIYFFTSNSKRKKALNTIDNLTKQEHNILELIREDKSNKEIAEALFVSVSTIKTHVNNIFKKLKVQSREDIKKLNNK